MAEAVSSIQFNGNSERCRIIYVMYVTGHIALLTRILIYHPEQWH